MPGAARQPGEAGNRFTVQGQDARRGFIGALRVADFPAHLPCHHIATLPENIRTAGVAAAVRMTVPCSEARAGPVSGCRGDVRRHVAQRTATHRNAQKVKGKGVKVKQEAAQGFNYFFILICVTCEIG